MKGMRAETEKVETEKGDKQLISRLEDYSAPFLVAKLQERNVAQSPDEAALLFREIKRYFVLISDYKSALWPMYSALVDGTWHQFVLYTSEYEQFCSCYFGHYMHHVPGNQTISTPGTALATRDEFADLYRAIFGESLPYVWYDEHCVNDDRRVARSPALLRVSAGQNGSIVLLNANDVALAVMNGIAGEALEFVLKHQAFYVRELQSCLRSEERHSFVAALAQLRVLRITP